MKTVLVLLLGLNSALSFASCGLTGTIEERIISCKSEYDSSVGQFQLVTRTEDNVSAYKDIRTNYLWSDTLPELINTGYAKAACTRFNINELSRDNQSWELPKIRDFSIALSGALDALPTAKTQYITTSGSTPYLFYVWNNSYSEITYWESFRSYVRCVSKL